MASYLDRRGQRNPGAIPHPNTLQSTQIYLTRSLVLYRIPLCTFVHIRAAIPGRLKI